MNGRWTIPLRAGRFVYAALDLGYCPTLLELSKQLEKLMAVITGVVEVIQTEYAVRLFALDLTGRCPASAKVKCYAQAAQNKKIRKNLASAQAVVESATSSGAQLNTASTRLCPAPASHART